MTLLIEILCVTICYWSGKLAQKSSLNSPIRDSTKTGHCQRLTNSRSCKFVWPQFAAFQDSARNLVHYTINSHRVKCIGTGDFIARVTCEFPILFTVSPSCLCLQNSETKNATLIQKHFCIDEAGKGKGALLSLTDEIQFEFSWVWPTKQHSRARN